VAFDALKRLLARPSIIIIINIHNNVYGAIITTTVIATVHPVYLMNAD